MSRTSKPPGDTAPARKSRARAAGLTPCRLCRPDQTQEDAAALPSFQELTARVRTAPGVSDEGDFATSIGLTRETLQALVMDHAHMAPRPWLLRQRIRNAARQLLDGRKLREIAQEHGFRDRAEFDDAFLETLRMSPSAYRALDTRDRFELTLPTHYRPTEILAYQGRDPSGICERVEGNRIWKALMTADGPVVLEIALGAATAKVSIHAPRTIGRDSKALLHADALGILGLMDNGSEFEGHHPHLTSARRGLRISAIRGFEALCWAITGQQINLSFAATLRRDMIRLAGVPIGGMRAHPTAEALAQLGSAPLTAVRYSRSKAQYLVTAAEAEASGQLDIDKMNSGSALQLEQKLLGLKGVGPWTARYVLLRGGFADSAPVGDSGLASALQRLHQLIERPDALHAARLMTRYAPHRSLATAHLWASLADARTTE